MLKYLDSNLVSGELCEPCEHVQKSKYRTGRGATWEFSASHSRFQWLVRSWTRWAHMMGFRVNRLTIQDLVNYPIEGATVNYS